jgi:arylsulfatase A-like enzyme
MRKDAWALSEDSWTLPKALLAAPDDWSSAAIGKWHLAGEQAPEFLDHPLASGFGRTAGSPGYLVINTRTGEDGYFHWLKNDDGTAAFSDVYNTTDVVDEALLAAAEMPEPWFLWVAFNAAHEPLHVPPPELHDRDVTESSPDGDLHDAVAQAMDTELDRLLAGIDDERLTVVVVGDNGTPDFVADPEVVTPSEGKGTIHEGGVRVPLLIRTPDVADPGRHSDALVHVVDLFPTLLQAAGVPLQQDPGGLSVASPLGPTALDGLSLLPILEDASARLGRDILYTERLEPNGPPPWSDWGRALRDPSWKLEVRASGNVDLHRLGPGLDEGPDLLDAGTLDADALDAFDRLMAALAVQDARLVYEGR